MAVVANAKPDKFLRLSKIGLQVKFDLGKGFKVCSWLGLWAYKMRWGEIPNNEEGMRMRIDVFQLKD